MNPVLIAVIAGFFLLIVLLGSSGKREGGREGITHYCIRCDHVYTPKKHHGKNVAPCPKCKKNDKVERDPS
jgi:hypothetical protein